MNLSLVSACSDKSRASIHNTPASTHDSTARSHNTSASSHNTTATSNNTTASSKSTLSQREKKKRKNKPVQLEIEHWTDDFWPEFTTKEIQDNLAKAKKLL